MGNELNSWEVEGQEKESPVDKFEDGGGEDRDIEGEIAGTSVGGTEKEGGVNEDQ